MAIFNIFNVGQGDCIMIDPPGGCHYSNRKIFVDLGPGAVDVTKNLKPDDAVQIVITHHDADHLNGIRFFIDKLKQVETIYLPLHQNEITIIAKSILQLKGIKEAENCDDFLRNLEDIVANQRFLYEILNGSHRGPRLRYLCEGVSLCKHIICLNPPREMKAYRWIGEANQEQLGQAISKFFEPHYAQALANYLFSVDSERTDSRSYKEESSTISELLLDREDGMRRQYDFDENRGKSYVIDFFMGSYEMVEAFNSNPSRKTLAPLYEKFIKRTHDACVVLSADYEGEKVLLTGDASKNVFNRLIQQEGKSGSRLKAGYLKLPHHGSKNNIDERILDYISPHTVIISHDNRRFGKAKDSHPNQEVLEMLQERNMDILLTNDVIKHGVAVMEKRNHTCSDRFIQVL